MMNANSHFDTLRYLFIMYTILFIYVAHYLMHSAGNSWLMGDGTGDFAYSIKL